MHLKKQKSRKHKQKNYQKKSNKVFALAWKRDKKSMSIKQ